jgi:hypothetical protein
MHRVTDQKTKHEGDGVRRPGRVMVGIQLVASTIVALVLVCPARAALFNIAAGDVAALIKAINTANGNNEDDTINLAAGTYTLTAVDSVDTNGGRNGLPSITSSITLHGTGANGTVIARDANAPDFRILHVTGTGVLTLDGVTVTGGGGFPFEGVSNDGGRVTLLNSILSHNLAGILNEARGTITLLNSTVSFNGGGFAFEAAGIENLGGTLTLLNTSVSNNDGGFEVGGIDNLFGGTVTLLNSNVSENFGSNAGGISNGAGGSLTVTNTTVSGNLARSDGTAGIYNDGGTVTLTNSTVSNNSAVAFGGILSENGGTVEMTHTIVAGNTGGRGSDQGLIPADCAKGPLFSSSPGQFISQGHNLVGASGGCPSDGSSDLTVDPANVFTTVLGPLQNNGGPTQTHALLPGSPAIDAGNTTCTDASGNPLTTDQRGRPRPVDGNGDGTSACDIGAFEFFPIVNNLVELVRDLETSFDSNPVPGGPAGTFTITATFTNTGATLLHFLFFGVSQLSGGNLLLNADGGPGGVGATLTPEITGDALTPGAEVTAKFIIGLQRRQQFTFFVNVFAEPLQ